MPRTSDRGGAATRARIAATASALFLDRGFDAVTVTEVAQASGVSAVTVFKHFPKKEDLFLDRADDAARLLQECVRDRADGVDVLSALHDTARRLLRERHALSGTDPRSGPFFRTIAASPSLTARARELAAELQRSLVDLLRDDASFRGDPELLAALTIGGYSAALVATARQVLAGGEPDAVLAEQRERVDRLFDALRSGLPV